MHLISYINEFGLIMFIRNSLTRIMRKLKISDSLINKFDCYKHKRIVKYLNLNYGKYISNVYSDSSIENIERDCNIWIFWWQGEKKMPLIVKKCYESVKSNAKDHKVVLIDKNNLNNYVDFPQFIYDRIETGNITITHFSDILREKLLYMYGGIWMDATIFMTDPFPDSLYNNTYYTLNGAFKNWKWSGFFQASSKDNMFPKQIYKLFELYWKEHNELITYLLIDCFFELAYENNNKIKQMIDGLDKVDDSIFCLNDKMLDLPFDEKMFNELKDKSNIHKLSYKFKHTEEIDGKSTFYKEIINGKITG